ncbi:catalase [Flavitalea flava]
MPFSTFSNHYYERRKKAEFPQWHVKIQIMTLEQADKHPFNPFDLTKTWSQKEYPLIDVGVLELNEVPKNYFAEVEQAAFAPAYVVDGISYSPDKMLQGRVLSYPDGHRYHLGANYEQIPVNRCPYAVNNYERDGHMRIDGNGENDHYTQPGIFYRDVLSPQDKKNLVSNITGAMSGISGPKRGEIINRQLCHFFRADIGLGMAVAQALGVNVDDAMKEVKHTPAAATV